jgi:hypothetical protein
MLTCFRIRHNCLTHMCLLQGAPISASTHTHCCVPITILYIWMEWLFSDRCQTFSWWGNVAWHPRRRLTWIFSWYQGCCVCITYFVYSLIYFRCIVISRISLGHIQPVLVSFHNSAFNWFILQSYPLLIRPRYRLANAQYCHMLGFAHDL